MGRRWVSNAGLPEEMNDLGAFESDILAIHVVDAEGLIMEVNRAFELMFGASRRLYLGKHQAILGADPVAAGLRLLNGIRRDVDPRGVWHGTMRNVRFNGSTFTTRAHAYPMRVGERAYLVFFQEEVRAATRTRAPVASRARRQAFAATG
jgi:PAS domain S-box-containing protein